MSEEIDINKLHGIIRQYALAAERDSKGSKGYGKLNSTQELKLFKEMVIKNGKQAELIRQLPNIKGVSVPIKKDTDQHEQKVNERIKDLIKDRESSPEDLRKAVSEKFELRKPKENK